MLKFLEGREEPRTRRVIDRMRQSSHSFLPANKQFTSPLHQEAIQKYDKPTDYVYKKLPPIDTYNPVAQVTRSIERPEYIVKQKDVYAPKYYTELKTHGFKIKSGIFQSFQHLLNSNKVLIQGVHPEKQSLKLPEIKIRENKSITQEHQLPLNKDSLTSRLSNHSRVPPLATPKITNESQAPSQNTAAHQKRKSRQVSDLEYSRQRNSRFEDRFNIGKEALEEKINMMHQLSQFDKMIRELREKQAQSGYRRKF